MKKNLLMSILLIGMTVMSCSDEIIEKNVPNENSDFISEVQSLQVTNNFLKSLKNADTRSSISTDLYPNYYGGYYIGVDRKPVFLVVNGLETIAKVDLEKRCDSDFFEIKECDNSFNSLNSIIELLDAKFFDENFSSVREDIGWVGYCIGMLENVIKVDLEECSSTKIKEFREKVLDSPLIVFQTGSKIVDSYIDNQDPILDYPKTRAVTDLHPGQYLKIPGYGDGSMGFPVTRLGYKGFVTCGHVVPTGVAVEGFSGMGTIGVCEESIRGGTDVAFVSLETMYSFVLTTAYGNKYLNLSLPVVLGVNDYVQKDGSSTFWTTGSVIDTGYRGTFDSFFGSYTVSNLTVTNYKSATGDSGGCVYSLTNSIAGMHMGASPDGKRHYYIVVDDIVKALNVSL